LSCNHMVGWQHDCIIMRTYRINFLIP
jgi:hypothetical protein